MSNFAKRSGHVSGATASAWMRRGRTQPNSVLEPIGTVVWLVVLLTDGAGGESVSTPKERSRIARYCRLLCGTAAIGLTFRVDGSLLRRLDHFTSLQNPSDSFAVRKALAAS